MENGKVRDIKKKNPFSRQAPQIKDWNAWRLEWGGANGLKGYIEPI